MGVIFSEFYKFSICMLVCKNLINAVRISHQIILVIFSFFSAKNNQCQMMGY